MTPEIKQRIQQIRQGKTPKGYKKYEDGIYPNDWKNPRLGELGSLKNGMNFSKEAMNKGFPFVNLMNIFGRTIIDYNNLGKAEASEQQLIEYNLLKGDVLFVRSSVKLEGVGEAALVPIDLPKTTYSGFIIRFRDESGINNSFKQYIFSSNYVRKQLMSKATDSANKNINQSVLSELSLALPPLAEQTAIAEILSTQDRVIDLKEQLLAEKKRQKKYLMQQLLTGKKRLKGFKGEWKKCRLGEVAEFSKGCGYSKSDIDIDGDIPIILYGRLYTNYQTIIKDIDTYTNLKIKNAVLSKGIEVIVPASGETAEDIAIASCIEAEGIILGGDLNIIYPEKTILPSYLANLISYGPLHFELSKKAQGKSVVHLHNDDLSNVIIEFPPLPEQTAIAEILSTADREIELLAQSIEAEKQKKKSLMQLLLTGIVRVGGVL